MMGHISINVSEGTSTSLIELASRLEVDIATVVERATTVYEYLDDGMRSGGQLQLMLTELDGTVTEVASLAYSSQ
jgi:hypothetical protein